MPARRKARSLTGNPAGSMRWTSTPRQAARRSVVPVFWGISGSNKAIRIAQVGCATVPRPRDARNRSSPINNWYKSRALAALAGLHSAGKGAKKPTRWCSAAYSPEYRRIRLPSRGPLRGSALDRVRRPDGPYARLKGRKTVTTMSAAEPTRRDFLLVATGAVGAIGAAAALVPLISQMNPDASTIAAGVPIEVDLTPIAEGQIIKVFWRGNPIYISHRTGNEIEEAQKVPLDSLPDPQADKDRVKSGHDQWLVAIGVCTHLGRIPLGHHGDYRGWVWPRPGCHHSPSAPI